MSLWVRIPGRLEVRLHRLLLVAVAGLFALGGDLWLRYLLLLGTLAAHEFAHAVTSLALGARRTVVSIWPVFGRADVETWTDRRVAVVALSAPVLNLAIAGGLALAGAGFTFRFADASLLDFTMSVNLLMGLGNLIPIPPIDGGRALRALRRPR